MEEKNDYTVQGEANRSILLNVLKFIGFVVLAVVPTLMLSILMDRQNQFSTTVNSILAIICFLLIVLLMMFLWNRHFRYSSDKAQKMRLRDIGFAFLFFMLARVIAVVGSSLTTWIYGEKMTANDEAIMTMGSSDVFILYFILFVLSIGMLQPIAEELTFRGIGTNLLFNKNRFWLPLIVTSSIFGLMHTPTNVISFLLYGLIGVVFFLAYYRRKNIVDSIFVHILNNIMGAILLLVSYMMEIL